MIVPRALVVAAVMATSGGLQQTPVFRARADVVTVSVAVKKGNNTVPGLTASEFHVLDRGVKQQVDLVEIAAVPLDVTLFMDTSGSTFSAQGAMVEAVQRIAGMLRPGDRFRLLTIGHAVHQSVPWTDAGALFEVRFQTVGGISLIYDAMTAALRHAVDPGRRHLIVAMTDGLDCGSVVDPALLVEASRRTDAVVHWIHMVGGGRPAMLAWCEPIVIDPDLLELVVGNTGGEKRGGFLSPDPAKAFERILSDFRQSYILTFVPTGVDRPGWHPLTVTVPGTNYTVHAKPGYFGG